MAVASVSTPSACAEVTCPTTQPSTVERQFARLAWRLRVLSRNVDALDNAMHGTVAFHEALRSVELAEERISSGLAAIVHGRATSATDLHIRQFCWKLHLALSIEDGEDASYTLNRIRAVSDLLYLPLSAPAARRVNAMVGTCLDAIGELQAQNVPALQALRTGGTQDADLPEPVPAAA